MEVEAYPAFRFAVQIEGVTEAMFTECTLPSLEVDVREQLEGGYNDGTHLLPGRVKRGTVALKRGVARQSALLRWYNEVMQGQIAKSRRQVSVLLLDSLGETVLRWDFVGAYPTKWSGPTLNSGSKELAVETLELGFENVTVG
ncbi:MAG: phage tail protein [Chloroflexi bacterium]|jgi:phage tail-like protein|nr:phage tail protein [Chloroflexota bacterium]